MVACSHGYPEVVALLLSVGACPWAADMHGRTALHHACRSTDPKCLQLLLQHPSASAAPAALPNSSTLLVDVPDASGLTALHYAMTKQRTGTLQALLAAGANVCARSATDCRTRWLHVARGATVLDIAARRNMLAEARAVLRHYAEALAGRGLPDPRTLANANGVLPWQLASYAGFHSLAKLLAPWVPLCSVIPGLLPPESIGAPPLKQLAAAALQGALLRGIDGLGRQQHQHQQPLQLQPTPQLLQQQQQQQQAPQLASASPFSQAQQAPSMGRPSTALDAADGADDGAWLGGEARAMPVAVWPAMQRLRAIRVSMRRRMQRGGSGAGDDGWPFGAVSAGPGPAGCGGSPDDLCSEGGSVHRTSAAAVAMSLPAAVAADSGLWPTASLPLPSVVLATPAFAGFGPCSSMLTGAGRAALLAPPAATPAASGSGHQLPASPHASDADRSYGRASSTSLHSRQRLSSDGAIAPAAASMGWFTAAKRSPAVAPARATGRSRPSSCGSSSCDAATCGICLEQPQELVLVPCGHRLCVGCCRQLVQHMHNTQPPSCPFCRAALRGVSATAGATSAAGASAALAASVQSRAAQAVPA